MLLLTVSIAAQEQEEEEQGQDASIEIISLTDFNGKELHFSIKGITNTSGPYEIQVNTYSESGEKVKIATKYYDGASWNFIPAGSERFDWIEVDPFKLHEGYNIITVKIVFSPLNSAPDINPSNDMDSMVLYCLPELPDLEVSNPRYYSAVSDTPVVGAPSGIKFDVTNIGTVLFNGKTTVWFSSDKYHSKSLPLNKNNLVEMQSDYQIFPGQTITVALANYRPWGELFRPGADHLNFGIKTLIEEEEKENNNGTFEFVVKPK